MRDIIQPKVIPEKFSVQSYLKDKQVKTAQKVVLGRVSEKSAPTLPSEPLKRAFAKV